MSVPRRVGPVPLGRPRRAIGGPRPGSSLPARRRPLGLPARLVAAALREHTGRPILLLGARARSQRHRLAAGLRFFLASVSGGPATDGGDLELSGDRRVLEFPPAAPAPPGAATPPRARRRARALLPAPAGRRRGGVVATPSALAARCRRPPPSRARAFSLEVGGSIDREILLELLEAAGYERVETRWWRWGSGACAAASWTCSRPPTSGRCGPSSSATRSSRCASSIRRPSARSRPSSEMMVLPLELDGTQLRVHCLRGLPAADTLVVLEDPALLEAPPEDAPSARAARRGAGRGFQRLELPLLQRGSGAAPRVAMGTRSVGGYQRAVQGAGRRDPRMARRGLHGAPRRGRRPAGDRLPPDARPSTISSRGRAPRCGAGKGSACIVGECAAGFQIPALGLVVLCEEEIFGARRRRLRRPVFQRGAAIASFTDLSPNDLVVHEQHGIGRYHGLRPARRGPRRRLPAAGVRGGRPALSAGRAARPDLQVHGRARGRGPPRPAGRRRVAAPQGVGAGGPARDGGGTCSSSTPRRSVAERPPFSPTTRPGSASSRPPSASRRPPDQLRAIEEVKTDMEGGRPDGPPGGGRRGLRQDRGRAPRRLQGGGRRPAGGGARAHHRAGPAALQHLRDRFGRVPGAGGAALALPQRQGAEGRWWRGSPRARWTWSSGTHRLLSKDVRVQATWGSSWWTRSTASASPTRSGSSSCAPRWTCSPSPPPPSRARCTWRCPGVRDLSVIETPPLDRLPVETVVTAFNRTVIKEAIERELEPGRPGLLRPQPHPVAAPP